MAVAPDRVRFTIAVDAEVYEAFADLAHASGVSLSRCIGEWLRDTTEAAQITTLKLQHIRRSPDEAFRAYYRDALEPIMQRIREREARAAGGGAAGDVDGGQAGQAARKRGQAGLAGGTARQVPPASNTGGKSPRKAA